MVHSNSQTIAKNTIYLFVRTLLVLLVTLYTSRVILKTLGFEDFGLYNVVGSIVIFFSFFQTALNNATYRYLAYELGTGDEAELNKVYSMAINSHLLLALILFILLELGGVWFLNFHLKIAEDRVFAANWVFQFSTLTFCTNIIRTPFNSNIIAHEHMNFYALVSIIEVILRLGVVMILVWSPIDKLVSYGGLLLIVAVISLIIYIRYCISTFKDCRYMCYWDSRLIKQFISYSSWSMLVNVADVTTSQSISIFFFNILGSIANAALGIANQVNGAINAFLHTFTQAFNPQIIKNYAAGRKDTFMHMIFSTSKISYVLCLLLALPVLVNINFILHLWLGDYPAQTPSFVQIIIIFSLIDALQAPLWQAVHATGKIKIHQIMMSGLKIMAIPTIYFFLINGFDGTIALCVWVSFNLLCAIVRTIYLHHLIELNINKYLKEVVCRVIILTIISAPITALTAHYLQNNWKALFCSSSIAFLLVGIVGYWFVLNQSEKNILKSLPFIKIFTKAS